MFTLTKGLDNKDKGGPSSILPRILDLEDAWTFLALADALDLDQVHGVSFHIE